MRRREFLKTVVCGIIGAGIFPAKALAEAGRPLSADTVLQNDEAVKDYLVKMRSFSRHHSGDVCLRKERYRCLESSVKRLIRLQRFVGYANFHLLNFDAARAIARATPSVGEFPRDETDFLEMIFYEDAALLGFMDEKPLKNLTDLIHDRDVIKVPSTGHYLYRGRPLETYKKIKKVIGDQLILTSGVRGVVKQFLLFLNKAYANDGNLSLASRQLAPPGYSFHGTGDFDVGQVGFGTYNFTEYFINSDVYKKLEGLGYLSLRYPQDNLLGVRFEPWHIKVFGKA